MVRRGGRAITRVGEVSPPFGGPRSGGYSAGVPSEPEVVLIPAGDALLEDPPRTVHVNVFAIARAPVTNAEFAGFAASAGHRAAGWHDGPADHPAEGLTWADAVAYCRWLSMATGHVYRLPDEREWEKAARGTAGRPWPWGDAGDASRANVRESARAATTPIGAYPGGASPEGLVDLVGNVREWTNTWAEGGRVLRGGSYLDALADCAPSRRLRAASDLRGVGFRVVRSLTGR